MSRRAVRRALSEQTGEAAEATVPVTVPDPETERPAPPDAAAPRVSNVFSLLAEEENGDVFDAADETNERHQATSESAPRTPPAEPPTRERPKSHRHRRRRRRRPAHAQQRGNEGADEAPDVVDVVQSPADGTANSPLPPDRAEHSPVRRPLFAVDRRQLRPDTELMRKFGKRAVRAERHEVHTQSVIIDGGARYRTPRITRSLFVTPQRHWPAYAPGLHMEIASADADHSFRYVHAPAYAALQAEFALRAETLDPTLLVELLAAHPYHVDTLLQVGEMYRAAGELDHAGECVQRALLVLEQAFHRRFVLGDSQLPFACAENRSLYAALFRFAQRASRQGCHRTALELSKALLSLSNGPVDAVLRGAAIPEAPAVSLRDPTGALLVLDAYALWAKEWHWILQATDSETRYCLRHYPNWQYSRALALKRARVDLPQLAEVALHAAMRRHPQVARALLGLPVETEQTHSVLQRMARVYALRAGPIWQGAAASQWLKQRWEEVGDAVGADTEGAAQDVRFLERHRLYESILVGDFADSGAGLPPEMIEEAGAPEAIAAPATGDASIAPDTDSESNRTLSNVHGFLHSLLPWNALPAEDTAGRAAEARENWARLWDALQDALRGVEQEDEGEGEEPASTNH